MVRKIRMGRRPELLSHELEVRLIEGMDFFCETEPWNVDADLRRELWFQYRDVLVERWGPVEKIYAWFEFEASPEQRAAFRFDLCPSAIYATRDGIGTVSTPENPALQALRAAQRAKMIPHDVEEGIR